MIKIYLGIALFTCNVIAGDIDLKNTHLINETAYITSQCYTKTEDAQNPNILHNPCFSCHIKNKIPNYALFDDELQLAYDFPAPALKNPWSNLFLDRTKAVNAISDASILTYVREDNYLKNGKIILQEKLKNLQPAWDFNDNHQWDGYVPDCYFHFDDEGFDQAPNGDYTGWRAFAYYPFLGTFWPTNGSTDDVLIRLAKPFQHDENGHFDKEVYKLNLLITESLIKQKSLVIAPTDEKRYGVDLNQNGVLDVANEIVFNWKQPAYDAQSLKLSHFSMSYVGEAKKLLESNDYLIAPGLYPKDTEFLHSVRYIDIDANGEIALAPRMKELRYGKKLFWYPYFQLSNAGMEDLKEKESSPDNIDIYIGNPETGLNNKIGWYYQGFIEDAKGDLRPQSYEETLFCMGCHNNIGAIADSTFVFQRKFEKGAHKDGWYHWSEKGFKGVRDMLLPNGESEYVRYLKNNNAGDEFRDNEEVMEKFFVKGWQKDSANIQKELLTKLENPNVRLEAYWKLKKEAIAKLRDDIAYLLLPSKQRALTLNKAYKVIVEEQSFIYGRDAHVKPVANVHKELKPKQMTQLEKIER
ncbi:MULTISPECIES: hypothetical protein [unclassified Sulfurospirillum]|uniref:hypothetical protein n=1 Tax=unclassified Sulfurospirillum TaxID=2618290 RepID=UPI0005051558|nr:MULTISPECIES: hypothetical protein [unclassified Sulfurospirillum]KFL34696.1 hypothetical protein JU57_03420 [Sulfurospirillum sp. SCADC]